MRRRHVRRRGHASFGTSKSWGVYLNGRQIDRVFFDQTMTADEVRRSLIAHDGYDPAIVVRRHKVKR